MSTTSESLHVRVTGQSRLRLVVRAPHEHTTSGPVERAIAAASAPSPVRNGWGAPVQAPSSLVTATEALVAMLIGRTSFNGDRTCSCCHRSAHDADGIAHAPSCRVGHAVQALREARKAEGGR